MGKVVSFCLALLISSLFVPSAALADTYQGTWIAQPSGGAVNIELNYRHTTPGGNESWNESNDEPYSNLRNVSSNGFTLVRDAGEFHATGSFRNGQGQGTWVFYPSAAFARDLQSRGIASPSEREQFELAMGRFSLQSLDNLLAAGFQRPAVHDLVRMGQHGVDAEYIGAFRSVDLSPKTIDGLIRMRDHGVTPEYAAAMSHMGYRPSADDLIRLVDHGVSIAFVEKMRAHGYTHLSADDLIRLRDHGF